MKKITLSIILFCIICLTGCSKKEDKPETTNKPQETAPQVTTPPVTTPPVKTPEPTPTVKKDEPEKPVERQNDLPGAIRVKIPNGEREVTLTGKINGYKDKLTYIVESKKEQVLLVKVISEEMQSNIRISQIISPSGKTEGPFDRKRKHELNETGDWKIILAENEKGGPSWKGEFKIYIGFN